MFIYLCLQCFDAVGWVAGRASGLWKTEWWGAGMVICLERGAYLHTAQLMPLPFTVSCFSKIQIGCTFLVSAYPSSPWKGAVKCVCVCVHFFMFLQMRKWTLYSVKPKLSLKASQCFFITIDNSRSASCSYMIKLLMHVGYLGCPVRNLGPVMIWNWIYGFEEDLRADAVP